MSTRNIFRGVKCGRWVGPTALPPSFADCLDILWSCPGLYRDCFAFS